MPYRMSRYAAPIKMSQIAASLIVDVSDLAFRVSFFGGVCKARSSFRRNIASFCCLMRSGSRNLFFSGSGIEFTDGSWAW